MSYFKNYNTHRSGIKFLFYKYILQSLILFYVGTDTQIKHFKGYDEN